MDRRPAELESMTVMIVWLVGQPDFSAVLVPQSIPERVVSHHYLYSFVERYKRRLARSVHLEADNV